MCSGKMGRRLVSDDEFGHAVNLEYTCERCLCRFNSTLGAAFVSHPAVVGFCFRHGVNLREKRLWELDFALDPDAVGILERGASRVVLEIELEDDVLELEVDENGDARDVSDFSSTTS